VFGASHFLPAFSVAGGDKSCTRFQDSQLEVGTRLSRSGWFSIDAHQSSTTTIRGVGALREY
jgi:hypothetical protein